MSDPSQVPPPVPPAAPTPEEPELPSARPSLDLGPGVGIGVQQDMAAPERKLPPLRILGIAIAALAVVVGIFSLLTRAKPQGNGSIDNVAAVEIPGQNAMSAATTALNSTTTATRPLGRTLAIFGKEAKYEFLKLLRLPIYAVSTMSEACW